MSNVFVPFTPYNALLSLAIATKYPNDENFMILAGKDYNSKDGIETLAKIFHSVGIRCFSFERDWDDSNIRNFFLKKHNLKTLQRELAALSQIERLYYVREWSVYTTCAIHVAETLNPNVRLAFMEDGIFTYVEEKKERKNFVERLGDRIAYGSWHDSVETPGMLRPNAAICAMFPDILPDIFRGRSFEQIDLAPLLAKADTEVLALCTNSRGTEDIGTLIALDDRADEEYRKIIASFMEKSARENSTVAIKRHPNDGRHVSFTLPGIEIVELTACVPIELFYFRCHKTITRVVGGLSTALMTARRLLPGAEILSIVSPDYIKSEPNAEKILNLFSKIGIKVAMA